MQRSGAQRARRFPRLSCYNRLLDTNSNCHSSVYRERHDAVGSSLSGMVRIFPNSALVRVVADGENRQPSQSLLIEIALLGALEEKIKTAVYHHHSGYFLARAERPRTYTPHSARDRTQ